ncbi:MAG TPA: gamma-glutamyltransferase [Solirubrobacteraceae bacterium]|nr:gamma-glutamyltransferase [Solirubrobacteraceae bacterium]
MALLRGGRGVVSCGHPLAASAGATMLAAGGTAADAAVAAGAMLCAVLPDACGLGGDALALVRSPGGEALAYNGSGAAPAALAGPVPADGAGASAVPGALAALADLHGRHGRLEWADVLRPAIATARDGMVLTETLAGTIARHRPRLERRAPGWSTLDPSVRVGARLRQPELAALLERIAAEGPAALYEGEVAAAIAAVAAADGGSLAATDLAAHRTPVLAPITRERLGATITAQPPVSQALLVLIALGALEASDAAAGADRVHHLVEAIVGAFAYRDAIGRADGASALADAPVEIDPDRASCRTGPRAGAHTTAVAAADAGGTVVSMLLSVFEEFGSAALVAPGGFFLNNRLHGFTAGENRAAPGRRPVHTLSPLLVSHGRSTYALCTPGADGQVQTLSQILAAVLLDGVSLPNALAAPRWRSGNGTLLVEDDYDSAVLAELRRRGHQLVPLPHGVMEFGAAACAGIDAATGTTFAVTDPRQEVWAAAV